MTGTVSTTNAISVLLEDMGLETSLGRIRLIVTEWTQVGPLPSMDSGMSFEVMGCCKFLFTL